MNTLLATLFLLQSCCEKQQEIPCTKINWDTLSYYIPKNTKLNDYWVFKETINNTLDTLKVLKFDISLHKGIHGPSKTPYCRGREPYKYCSEKLFSITNVIKNNKKLEVKTSLNTVSIGLVSNMLLDKKSEHFVDSMIIQGKTYHNISIIAYEERGTFEKDTIWFAKDIGPVKFKIINEVNVGNGNYNYERL